MIQKPQRRYSEAFKMQVISELESGKLRSQAEALKKYGIAGTMTVHKWLRKYGKQHLLPGVMRMETPEEADRMKELEKENKRLKAALVDSHMDAALYQSWFKMVCRKFGVADIEGFKKKLEKQLSE
jgi:transposase-like protein